MNEKSLVGIDLNGNELINVVLDPLGEIPTTLGAGHLYYNTTTNALNIDTGSGFTAILKSVQGSGSIAVGLSAIPGVANISVANATESEAGLMSASSIALLNAASPGISFNALVERDASGNIVTPEPTEDDHMASKAYVDALVSSGMRIVGGIDASGNPDYPAAIKGDAYKVLLDGIVGGLSGEPVTAGDLIIAIADTAAGDESTVGADWLILQKNIGDATEFNPGYIRLATSTEMTELANPDVAITPASLNTLLDVQESLNTATFVLALGGTKYQLQHDLGSEVILSVYEGTSGLATKPIVRRVTDDMFEIEVNKPLTDRLVVLVTRVPGSLTTEEVEAIAEEITLTTATKAVLVGVDNSCWFADEFTLPGDFTVSVTFAVANPYVRSNNMLFGGVYNVDLYCRLEQEDRSIKVWMGGPTDTDFIKFIPTDTNVYDGNMHTFTLKRIGSVMVAYIDNEYIGEQPAHSYTGANNIAIGMHRSPTAASLPFEGVIEDFIVTDANDVVLIDLGNDVGVTAQPGLNMETFVSVENSVDTLYCSTDSNLCYKRYVGHFNRTLNVVMMGASIMEQSFYSTTDATKRYIKHGMLARVYERATSGDTSADVLADVPAIIAEFKHQVKDTIIVLHVGGNDISQGGGYPGNATSLENNYIAIVQALQGAGFTVAPSSITYRIPPASNPSEPYNTNVILPQIERLMPDWINNGVPVIDLYTKTYDNQGTWFEGDGIHPNGFGEASIREYLATVVSDKLLNSTIMGDWNPYLATPTASARNVILNFGDDNYMLGNQNNVTFTGSYPAGEFRNTDYSVATGFGLTVSGVGTSISAGYVYGTNELSIRNIDISRSSIWISEGATGQLSFLAGSFESNGLYTVRIVASRATGVTRWTELTVAGVTQTVQANLLIPVVVEFTGVTAEALMSTGVTIRAQTGSEFAYISGLQFELEKPLS